MSAVLTPAIPSTISLQSPEFKETLKEMMISLIKEDHEFRETVTGIIEEFVHESDYRIPKRIAEIETKLGIVDYSYYSESEEKEPTIPEKIAKLEENLKTIAVTVKPELLNRDLEHFPKSLTDLRSDLLVEHMKTNQLVPKLSTGFANLEGRMCNTKEFRYFVEHVLPPEYRPKSIKNLRKLKKDIFENARDRHGLILDQAWHGRKELRLITAIEKPLPPEIKEMFLITE